MVAAVGNGFDKSGRGLPGRAGKAVAPGSSFGKGENCAMPRSSPQQAQRMPAWGESFRAAEIADGGAGKTQNRSAAKGARGGEQSTGERICGTSKHTNNSTPNRSLRKRNVGSQVNSLTRKDRTSQPAGEATRAALQPLCRVYG